MGLREALVKMQTLETGFNRQSGFTLIELLVTLVIIGLVTTVVFLNFSTLQTIESREKSFQKTFDFLSEESITTGNIIGWYADMNTDKAYFISMDGLKLNDSSIAMPKSGYGDLINF